jgi:hypothetical protein
MAQHDQRITLVPADKRHRWRSGLLGHGEEQSPYEARDGRRNLYPRRHHAPSFPRRTRRFAMSITLAGCGGIGLSCASAT